MKWKIKTLFARMFLIFVHLWPLINSILSTKKEYGLCRKKHCFCLLEWYWLKDKLKINVFAAGRAVSKKQKYIFAPISINCNSYLSTCAGNKWEGAHGISAYRFFLDLQKPKFNSRLFPIGTSSKMPECPYATVYLEQYT